MRRIGWLLGLGLTAIVMASEGEEAGRPNLLFIMSDDHTSQAFGSSGSRLAELNPTPQIDRLAEDGMRFENAFCVNSICSPSRAAILTGQYSHRNGVYLLNQPLDPEHPNLAKELQGAGYTTAVIGKWHLARAEPRGFDYWQILPGQGRYFNPVMREIGGERRTHKGFSADVIADLSLQWLEECRDPDKPFLLMTHFKSSHEPFAFPERLAGLYKEATIPEPATLWEDKGHRSPGSREYGFTIETMAKRMINRGHWNPGRPMEAMSERQLRRHGYQAFLKRYLRSVAAIDENVGRILDYLDETGLAENTVVIYTSDQGYFLGEHNYIDKRWFYEESARMPLLIRYPPEVDSASVNEDLILNVDFAPLLLDYAGVETPEYMQGRSFRGQLKGEEADDWRDAIYYRYWMHGNGAQRPAHYGIRTERYKLIFFYGLPLDQTGNPPTRPGWELYDLERDPHEVDNVYEDPAYGEVVDRLKGRLFELKAELGDTDDRYPKLMELREELDGVTQ